LKWRNGIGSGMDVKESKSTIGSGIGMEIGLCKSGQMNE
jgi:hypothetical protein